MMKLQQLTPHNPWWETKTVTAEFKGKPRHDYADVMDSVKIEEITIITGVRRSGKSTMMYQMIDKLLKEVEPEQILFINLEDPKLFNITIKEIYETYREFLNPDKKAYLFFDEVQKKNEWETWIRQLYDSKTGNKIILSGSSSHLLRKDYSTLLTGRNITFEIYPLSFREYLAFRDLDIKSTRTLSTKTKYLILNRLSDYISNGGFPAPLKLEERFKTKLLVQYFEDIIYKDIVDRYNLNSKKTKDLALYILNNITREISLRNIRNAIGLSYDTIKDYISYFIQSYLFFTLDHFSYSFKEQKTNPSKAYCIDSGLRTANAFTFSEDIGKLVENIVFIELKRRGKETYYWKGKGEIDFIIKEKNNTLTAINVTYTDDIAEREITALNEFSPYNDKKMIIITKNTEKKEGHILFIPLWKWLLES